MIMLAEVLFVYLLLALLCVQRRKWRFAVLSQTLHFMMIPSYIGVCLLIANPTIMVSLVLCLFSIIVLSRGLLRAISFRNQCHRRLPATAPAEIKRARLLHKKAAKARRSDIFLHGSRWVCIREFVTHCISILRVLAFVSVAFEMCQNALWLLSLVYHFLVFFQSACAFIFLAYVLYAHLFLLSVLLQFPCVRSCYLALREHFQDFVLLVVLWSGDYFRGCCLLSLWVCDVHFTTPWHCEYWSMLAYVLATLSSDSTFSSIYCFAMLGFFFPAFPSKGPKVSRHFKYRGEDKQLQEKNR